MRSRLLSLATALVLFTAALLKLQGCGRPDFAEPADVIALLDAPPPALAEQLTAAEGQRLFIRHSCNNCHAVQGPERGAPVLRNLYVGEAKLRDGQSVRRDREYVARSILRSQEQIVAGYPQLMSNYQFLPAEDVAAIVLYLETLTPPAPGD